MNMQKEAKFGVWRYVMTDDRKPIWRCSVCGKVCHKHPYTKYYCSNCGAKMKMEC